MAQIIAEVSRTFNEFLLLPNRTGTDCSPATVQELIFEEGVDGYVPYAGDLSEGLAVTIAKLKTTMVSCGAVTLPRFQSTARLTLVSDQSFQESHAGVTLRDTPATIA